MVLELNAKIVIQSIVNLILFSLNHLNGLGEVISESEIVSFNLSMNLVEFLVKFLETTVFSKIANFFIGSNENLCFLDSQIERKIAIRLQIIKLYSAGEELVCLFLDLVEVGKLKFTLSKSCRQAELPLDFVYNINTVERVLPYVVLPGT